MTGSPFLAHFDLFCQIDNDCSFILVTEPDNIILPDCML